MLGITAPLKLTVQGTCLGHMVIRSYFTDARKAVWLYDTVQRSGLKWSANSIAVPVHHPVAFIFNSDGLNSNIQSNKNLKCANYSKSYTLGKKKVQRGFIYNPWVFDSILKNPSCQKGRNVCIILLFWTGYLHFF